MGAGSLRPHILRVMSARRERPLSTGEIYEAARRECPALTPKRSGTATW